MGKHSHTVRGHTLRAVGKRLVRSRAAAWIVLAAGLVLTLAAALITWHQALGVAEQRFAFRSNEAVSAVSERMTAYGQALRGGLGLLRASDGVPRSAWRIYVESLDLARDYPGLQGIGYAIWLPPDREDSLVGMVRAEGDGDFRLFPEERQPDGRGAVLYLEPADAVNARALGFDMYSEAGRREAMVAARDSGLPATTGTVNLVQDVSRQPGFLMYLAHYGPGPVPDALQDRRARLRGWVYAAFRAADFMAPLASVPSSQIRLRLYGAATPEAGQLLFDSAPADPWPVRPHRGLQRQARVEIPGGSWTAELIALPGLTPLSDLAPTWAVLAIGSVVSTLGYAVLHFAYERSQAEARSARLGRIIEESASEVYVFDARSLAILQANRGARHNSGFTGKELRRMTLPDLQPELSHDRFAALVAPLIHHRSRHVTLETPHRRKDGSLYEASVTLQFHAGGHQPVFHALVVDVTERRRAANALQQALEDTRLLLEQKETLLREVHHRVRNNLQVIWSLVRLEAADMQEIAARRRMETMARRIGVLGQIHQQLYAIDTEARVDMGQQVDLLCRTLAGLHPREDIRLETDLDPVMCDLDTAVPLGLIANELVSNSYEHAFSAGTAGRIAVRLKRSGDGLELVVADTGAPAAAGSAKGLGLRMIEALVRQIGGEMDTVREDGTRTRVTIPAACSPVRPSIAAGAIPGGTAAGEAAAASA